MYHNMIFLADDTVAGNIALGVDSKLINQKNVEKLLKLQIYMNL